MKHRKFNLWTPEEDEIIKTYFHSIPFSSHHGSRFYIIQEQLKKKGFKRTTKSISRRSYRLGLRSVTINNEKKTVVCGICGKEHEKAIRYIKRDQRQRCIKCQKKNGGYVDLEKKKDYQKKYHQKWRKENDN